MLITMFCVQFYCFFLINTSSVEKKVLLTFWPLTKISTDFLFRPTFFGPTKESPTFLWPTFFQSAVFQPIRYSHYFLSFNEG